MKQNKLPFKFLNKADISRQGKGDKYPVKINIKFLYSEEKMGGD